MRFRFRLSVQGVLVCTRTCRAIRRMGIRVGQNDFDFDFFQLLTDFFNITSWAALA